MNNHKLIITINGEEIASASVSSAFLKEHLLFLAAAQGYKIGVEGLNLDIDWSHKIEYDVFLHKVPDQMEGTHWEGIGTVPFKHVGFLSAEEVGQISGGN